MATSFSKASTTQRLRDILASQVTWSELTPEQQNLFNNLNFNLTLNTDSPQQTYQLLQSSPDLLLLFTNQSVSPPVSTSSSPTPLSSAIVTANLLEDHPPLPQDKIPTNYQSPQSTVDWVQLALKNHLRNQQVASRLQSQPQIKTSLQKNISSISPKQSQPLPQTQNTLKKLVSSLDDTLQTSLTPSQKKQVVSLSQNILLSSSLQKNSPSPLITTITAINLLQSSKPDPIKIARQTDRIQKNLSSFPALTDQLARSQQEIAQFTHRLSTQPQTRKIISQVHPQITSQDISQTTRLYQKHLPSNQQKIFLPFTSQKAEQIASATEIFDPQTATIIRAYNQGLTSQDIDTLTTQPTIRLSSSQQQRLLLVKARLLQLEQSSPSPEIQPQSPSSLTQFFHRLPFGKALNYIPSGRFTKTLQVVLHPRSAISSYLGRRYGKRLAISFYKRFASKITNKSARFVAKSVLRQGLKGGLETASKLLTKKATTWLASKGIALGAEAALGSTGVGLIAVAAIEVGKFAIKIVKKGINSLQSVAVSLWGEKIKAQDILTAPLAFFATLASGFTAAVSLAGSAMATAATSAGLTIGISAAIAFLLYLTAFTTAPLISTIAQLQSSTSSSFGISTTCATTDNIFIYQGDPRWSKTFCQQCSSSGNCNIGGSGCGSASMTMILNSFGANTNVKDVWHLQHSLHGYVYTTIAKPYLGCGTDNNNSLKVLTQSGLSISEIALSEVDNVLSNCGLVLATGQVKYNGKYYGHLIVIIGHDNNRITTLDPGRSDGDHFVHSLGNSYKTVRLWSVVP